MKLKILITTALITFVLMAICGAYQTGTGTYSPPSCTSSYPLSPCGEPATCTSKFCEESSGFPAAGETYIDPIFGETVKRISDVAGVGIAYSTYSNLWGMNANNTKCFAGDGANYDIWDLVNGGKLRDNLSITVTGGQIHWHPTDADKIIYFQGSAIKEYSYSGDSTATIKDFGGSSIFAGGHGNICDQTGRYYAVLDAGSSGTLKVYDRTEDAVYTGGGAASSADHIFMVPDGSGVGVGEATNFMWYPLNHGTNTIGSGTEIVDYVAHEGVITDSSGDSWYVGSLGTTYELNNTAGKITEAGLWKVKLCTDPETVGNHGLLLSHSLTYSNPHHTSTNIINASRRDWLLFHHYYEPGYLTWDADPETPWGGFFCELYIINVQNGNVRRLAHDRNKNPSYTYGLIPKPSLSMDGTLVKWASNFGSESGSYTDIYTVTTGLANVTISGGIRFNKGASFR